MPFARYKEYVNAMQSNTSLRNGLNVSRFLDTKQGSVVANPDALPRANFPKTLITVQSQAESATRLATLDQHQQALIPAGLPAATQDPNATAQIKSHIGGHYRISYKAATPTVLRIGTAYFPGWKARLNNRDLPTFPIDHALIGTLLPPGEAEITLDYESTYFPLGLGITLTTLAACALVLWRR